MTNKKIPGNIIRIRSYLTRTLAICIFALILIPSEARELQEALVIHEKVRIDSLPIVERKFDAAKVEKFRNDPDYEYHVVTKKGLTWRERLLLILWNIYRQIFSWATDTLAGRLIFYVLCLAIVIFAIVKLFGIDVKGVFLHASKAATTPIVIKEENIHEISFEDRIEEAFRNNDFRECVRLTFLFALKKLSDHQIIIWKSGKTNDEYLRELNQHPVRLSWQELRLYFDYTWYGHFDVDEPTYSEIKKVFEDFNKKLS